MTVSRAGLAFCCLLLISLTTAASAAETVRHRLSFAEARSQYVHVESVFPSEGEFTELVMASWTPGSYLIREFAANLDRIRITDAAGRSLPFSKISKNRWQVESAGAESVVAEYDVHAGNLGVNTSWVSEQFVLINGASVFLHTASSRDMPHLLSVEPADSNLTPYTPLSAIDGIYQARNFDHLVDSPLVIANASVFEFSSAGSTHMLVNIGDSSLWDTEIAVKDVKAVADATQALWAHNPLDDGYWIFNFLVEHSGGLEHDQSTVLMTSRWQMRNRDDYLKWLSLVAHEYFHAWNVRRLKPRELSHTTFEVEQYSSQLWLAEGITSYYDNLLLSRAKIATPVEFFKLLARDLHKFETTPGRHLQSAEAASRDAWIRHYRPVPNSVNSTLSYYTRGAMIGLVLDARLRDETNGRRSLDDVMREMYRRYSASGYPEGAFEAVVQELGGDDFGPWLSELLRATTDPDPDEALEWFGLELDRDPDRTASEAAGDPVSSGFGVTWEKNVEELVIASVLHGSTGAAAGLLPGDELLAIAGERITREKLDDRLLRLLPGETVDLLLTRRGRIIELPVELGTAIPKRYQIRSRENLNGRHVRRMESWLGQDLTVSR